MSKKKNVLSVLKQKAFYQFLVKLHEKKEWA